MISKYVTGRVFVFIDAANIYYSQRTLGWKIDYAKLMAYFASQCRLKEARFYTAQMGDSVAESWLHGKIANCGYVVISKKAKDIRISGGRIVRKGNLDAELIIDALNNAARYDTCILMSGDGDFEPLVRDLRRKGKGVLVLSTKKHVSRELIKSTKYVDLKKLRPFLSLGKNKTGP